MTLPISTRQSVQKLRDRNFDEPQANAIVEVIEDATRELVTKADLTVTEEHFDSRLATFEARMDARFEAFEARMDARFEKQRAEFYRAFAGLAGLIITVAGLALAAARWLF